MKIIKLTAENVKRLKAVEIKPDGTLQVVTGRNAQGKTSVLDSIWLALGGGAASRETTRPIRDGEESASVTLDLGDLIVTRTWKGSKTSLTVASADGAKHSSPQSVLDALVGRLSFDPLEFTQLSDRDQVAALLDLVDLGIDLPKLDADRQRLYDERHAVGLKGKAFGDIPELVKDAPDEEVAASTIITQIRDAQEAQRVDRDARAGLSLAVDKVSELKDELANWEATVTSRQKAVSALPENAHDIDALEDQLAKVEDINRTVRANKDAKEKSAGKDALRAEYDGYTAKLEDLDSKKSKALAKAKFPVDGLGFDDTGVTYQGIPFSQSSSAEQIRVSLAMAMSLNPELRVIRILDGSLLDAENLALINDMAKDKDYQIWIERVADGSDVGVTIEDGEVA